MASLYHGGLGSAPCGARTHRDKRGGGGENRLSGGSALTALPSTPSLLADVDFEPDWPFDIGGSPFRVKGNPYVGLFEHADRVLPGGRDAVLQQVERPDLLAFLSQPFMPSGWYDLYPLLGLAVAAGKLVGQSGAAFTRRRSAEQADEDIHGIYRFLLRFTTRGISSCAR